MATFKQLLEMKRNTIRQFKVNLPENLVRTYLQEALQYECKIRRKEFVPNTAVINSATLFLTNWETKNSLMICGTIGSGKTTLLKAIVDVVEKTSPASDHRVVMSVNAQDIVNAKVEDRELFEEMCKARFLTIDDLGTESEKVQHYGTNIYPVQELLRKRYENDAWTVITTNLNSKQLADLYGERIADRFRETYETLAIVVRSYR